MEVVTELPDKRNDKIGEEKVEVYVDAILVHLKNPKELTIKNYYK